MPVLKRHTGALFIGAIIALGACKAAADGPVGQTDPASFDVPTFETRSEAERGFAPSDICIADFCAPANFSITPDERFEVNATRAGKAMWTRQDEVSMGGREGRIGYVEEDPPGTGPVATFVYMEFKSDREACRLAFEDIVDGIPRPIGGAYEPDPTPDKLTGSSFATTSAGRPYQIRELGKTIQRRAFFEPDGAEVFTRVDTISSSPTASICQVTAASYPASGKR